MNYPNKDKEAKKDDEDVVNMDNSEEEEEGKSAKIQLV